MQPSRPGPRVTLCFAALTAVAAAPPPASAQDESPATEGLDLEMYLDLQRASSPAISPDGRRVIYTRSHVDRMEDTWESTLWIMSADGSRHRALVDGSSPVWSPSGDRIAYVAEGKPEGPQVFVRWMDAEGAVSQVTRLENAPRDLRWSPDGERIAFTKHVENAHDENPFAHVTPPGRPDGAEWTADPHVVTRARWQMDGQGYVDDGHDQIFVVSADGGPARQLTEGRFHHRMGEWTPDGRRILFSANRNEDHEFQGQHSEVYAVDVAGRELERLTDRYGPDQNPSPSPDGEHIAYLGRDWSDDAYNNLDLYVMGSDGSEPRRISGDFDRRVIGDLVWAPDGSGVYFSADSEGTRNLHFASVDGGVRPVTEGNHMLTTSSISDDGRAVGTRTSYHEPGDVVTYRLEGPGSSGSAGASVAAADIERITALNDDLLSGVTLGEVEEIWYRAPDGLEVQGWLIKPPDFDPSEEYPLMLVIHGGPHAMYNVGFNFGWQEHAANGYLVLYTNPRGSSGYGSDFGNEIKFSYPGDDYYDLVAGVDTVVERGYVDTDNKFVYGCSGGGVLTAWVIARTNRFAAASSNCPVTNWISWMGTADIASDRQDRGSALSFREYFWDDPTEYLERSPLMYVGEVDTPTLLITGENDIRTPMGQTEEYYQALRYLGVPTAMVRVSDAWHSISSPPSNFLRMQLYLREWFEKWGDPVEPAAADTDGATGEP